MIANLRAGAFRAGADYLRGCFYQQFDLALQREFRFHEKARISFRLDAYNAFNQSHITGRNTTYQVTAEGCLACK